MNDAVNAEQQLNIESGSLTISAGDDALHCDLSLTVGASGTAGPDIDITGCYAGYRGGQFGHPLRRHRYHRHRRLPERRQL
ncbi:MAG: hypothetical protein V8S34_02035 [Lawsonibacter sp.]